MDTAQGKLPIKHPGRTDAINYRAIILAMLVLALCWIGWSKLTLMYHERLLAVERANVAARLSPYRNTLLTSLSRRLALLDGLKALAEMERDPDSIDRNFLPYAQNIVHDTAGIRALELMPQGIIKYVYPLAGNETAVNHNIFQDIRPEVIADVARTKKANTVVISGPLELLQGGKGLVVREAIYFDDKFWGFATVILDVPEVLQDAGLHSSLSDLNFVLYRTDDKRVIAGDPNVLEQQPIIHSIPLVDGSWSLAGIPVGGWEAQIAFQMQLFQLAGAILGILLGALSYFIYKRQETLERAVQQRTEELASLNEVLQDDIVKQGQIDVELIRLNSSMQAVSSVNQVISHAQDEISLMQEVCRILIEIRGHSLAWIGLVENDLHHTVRPVAQSGFDEGYLEAIELTWGNDEHGKGPAGAAIRSGFPVVSHDILNDPLYKPWRDEAIKRGFQSSVSLPLLDRGHVFGVLNIYSAEFNAFEEDELMELQDLAADLSFGVRALRIREEQWKAEAALRESEHRYRSLFMDNHAVILLVDPNTGKVVDANNSASEFYGYTVEQLQQLFIWDINTSTREELLLVDAVTQAVQQRTSVPQIKNNPPSAIEMPHLKILLAEDNPVNQLVTRKMLEKMGHDVILANDGLETLRIWHEQSPDLILMDIQMPNLDGIDTTRLIRAEEHGHIPIIAITANAMKGDNERCMAAGMDGYIAKPVNIERMRMEILRVCPSCRGTVEVNSSSQEPIFKYDEALLHMDNDKELFSEMIVIFIEGLPVQLTELHQHINNGDAVEARRLAHSLKGSARHFYADKAIRAAAELEDILKLGKLDGTAQLLQNVDDSFMELLLELKKLVMEGNAENDK